MDLLASRVDVRVGLFGDDFAEDAALVSGQLACLRLSIGLRRCIRFDAGQQGESAALLCCREFHFSSRVECFLRVGRDSIYPAFLEMTKRPNKAPEPTPGSVTPRADARVAPAPVVAHL